MIVRCCQKNPWWHNEECIVIMTEVVARLYVYYRALSLSAQVDDGRIKMTRCMVGCQCKPDLFM